MEIATTKSGGRPGRLLTPLGRLTLATVVVMGLVDLALLISLGEVDLWGPHLAIALVLFLLVGAGFRWAPGLTAFVMAAQIIEWLLFVGHELTSPDNLGSFAAVAILVPTFAVGACAGIG